MNAAELLDKYLSTHHTMQLATVAGEQPWICTVRYLVDGSNNLYWASLPTRRHSQELIKHPQVAVAIVVQNIIGKPVIGIQIEGRAEELSPAAYDKQVVERYATMFKRDHQWIEDFMTGNTEHRLYKLTPSAIYLFDEANFPGGQRQKVI